MLDGYISDLEKGDVFRPIEFEVTSLMATQYAHGVEQTHELFHSANNPLSRQVRPITAVHADKMKLLDANCLMEQRITGGRGPDWRIHFEHDAESIEPVFVGDTIRVSGRIADRYWKRGREYLLYEIEVHHADGRLLIRYRDRTLLRYRKKEETE